MTYDSFRLRLIILQKEEVVIIVVSTPVTIRTNIGNLGRSVSMTDRYWLPVIILTFIVN